MTEINNRKQYVLEWTTIFNTMEITQYPIIEKYVEDLFVKLELFESSVNKENLWHIFPVIIGIDSKLNILQSLLRIDGLVALNENQILEIVEKDYLFYTKESFGFRVNEKPNFSLLFNVK
ncbi:hypothetical protein FJO98_00030 [Enterococcus sp. PF-2]|uniref:DUF7006 family protein n=1 Tax=unclassified Enterococcus TaxID=2608891 RepID=UPI00111CC7DF|nr:MULTISPECIES: hypothetical protein [unclassified Enterococcus]TPE08091.1 hypothetical protein FJP08_00030 [Enterococcus sp. PF-3]TPE29182.1 hypothetical protein FJO98_00030 [Enterococcus sp. PF-2]